MNKSHWKAEAISEILRCGKSQIELAIMATCTDSYHMSQFGDYRPGSNIGHHEVEKFVRQRAHRGELRQGRIPLQPHWRIDYRQLVSDYLATLVEQQPQDQKEVLPSTR